MALPVHRDGSEDVGELEPERAGLWVLQPGDLFHENGEWLELDRPTGIWVSSLSGPRSGNDHRRRAPGQSLRDRKEERLRLLVINTGKTSKISILPFMF